MTANTHTNQRRVGKNWLSMGVNHGGRQGDESPRICSGGANAKKLSSDFQKNTAQNSPKHAISSEKFFFFSGEGPSPSPDGLHSLPQRSLLDAALRPAEVQPH